MLDVPKFTTFSPEGCLQAPAYHSWRKDNARFEELELYYSDGMIGSWIGPSSPREFIDNLMLNHQSSEGLANMPDESVEFERPTTDRPRDAKAVLDSFAASIKKFNLATKVPTFIFTNIFKAGGRDDIFRIDEVLESVDDGNDTPDSEYFDWSQDSLLVELLPSDYHDPFKSVDEIKKDQARSHRHGHHGTFLEKSHPTLKSVQGRLAAYAVEAFLHQHRTRLFQLLIVGEGARFLCWDHSGCMVSEKFNYVTYPKILAEFIWIFNHMSRDARGWDSSVSIASPLEREMFQESIKVFLENMKNPDHPQRELPHAEDTLCAHYPVYKMTVTDDISGAAVDVLVQRPFFRCDDVLSRFTRGYVAYRLSDGELLFVKDSWRRHISTPLSERTIMASLEDGRVPFVARVEYGGDVDCNDDLGTSHGNEWKKMQTLPVANGRIHDFRHHRILQKLAYPVLHAKKSREAVTAFRDVIDALGAARYRCELLYRDVSPGNVMFKDSNSSHGILADWDSAGNVQEAENDGHARTGTRPFMAISLLNMDAHEVHGIHHDFESLFWSLLYVVLQRCSVSIKNNCLDRDEAFSGQNTRDSQLAILARILDGSVQFVCKPLNVLITNLAETWQAYYALKSAGTEEMRAEDLKRPQYWRDIFDNALGMDGWIDDARRHWSHPYKPTLDQCRTKTYTFRRCDLPGSRPRPNLIVPRPLPAPIVPAPTAAPTSPAAAEVPVPDVPSRKSTGKRKRAEEMEGPGNGSDAPSQESRRAPATRKGLKRSIAPQKKQRGKIPQPANLPDARVAKKLKTNEKSGESEAQVSTASRRVTRAAAKAAEIQTTVQDESQVRRTGLRPRVKKITYKY